MDKKFKVFFCGIDEKVFKLLIESPDLDVIAVNHFDDLENYQPRNPVDLCFKYYYKAIQKHQTYLSQILQFLFRAFYPFGSKLAKKYYFYLNTLYQKKIKIIDITNTDAVVKYIKEQQIDLVVVSNWWKLPDEIIFAAKHGTINIHPSRLPQYRGSLPTLWSLKYKDQTTAVTFMQLNSKIDGGNLLAQYEISINDNEDSISLETKCDETIAKYFLKDLNRYLHGKIQPIAQDESKASNTAAYFPYMKIDWETETREEIVNKIKLYPHLWPTDFCYALLNNKQIGFRHAKLCDLTMTALTNAPAGTAKRYGNKIYIRTLNGIIQCKLFYDFSLTDSMRLFFCKNIKFTTSN